MPMNTDSLPLADMQIFVQVVAQHSFAGAARHLRLTTSAVSRSVGRLESELGVKLLNRTTRSLSLTEVGAAVHADCVLMLQSAELAVSRATAHRQQPQGVLRMSAPLVFGDWWLAPLLPGFCALFPEVQVQLTMRDEMLDLTAEGLDLAIRISSADALPPAMVARPLKRIRYLLVAHPAYLQTRPPITEPQDLMAHRCMSLGYGPFQNVVELACVASPAAPPVKLRLNTPITIASSHGLLNALQSNAVAGIALMAEFVACNHLAQGSLVEVLPGWQLVGSYAPRTAYALHAPGPHVPPKLRAMLDYLQSQTAEAVTSATPLASAGSR